MGYNANLDICLVFQVSVICGVVLSKKVSVRTGAGQEQNETISIYSIDQEPIEPDVTFSETGVVTVEIVIPVLCVKRISARKLRND